MWVKLSTDYVNLGEVIRVRFNRAWKNGKEEVVAEIEALMKGEAQIFTRYRGADAEVLQAALDQQAAVAVAPAAAAGNTLADL